MGFVAQTLPSTAEGTLLPYLFSQSPPLEQALLKLAVEASPAYLAKLEAIVIFAVVPLGSALMLEALYLSVTNFIQLVSS